ncbi:MAG: hypothetical protein Salg2KO_16060 [Salibacteraceae bacterium]
MSNKITTSLIGLVLIFSGCKVNYSFTGASVTPGVNTISIQTFPSYAPQGPPTLSQDFSETLKDIFLTQTNLTLVKNNGDLLMEGEITDYRIQSEAISNDRATQNKLTITVKVRYTDTKDDTKSYEQTFSNFAQFDANTNISSVESQLIEEINERLTQDIFNKSLGSW